MELQEASANFDLENVRPFLERLRSRIESGFSDPEIDQVQKAMDGMAVDDEKTFEFPIRYKGRDTVFQLHVFMDDIAAPDVSFFAVPELAEEIHTEIETFFEELGI